MKFKVTLERKDKLIGNPFSPGLINQSRPVELRTWEFEAESEEAVRKFYADAKADCVPGVIGFDLRSIELVESEQGGAM